MSRPIGLAVLAVALSVIAAGPAQADTFVVKSTADSGADSLRRAITDANGNAGADTIRFRIAGTGVRTIKPESQLPTVTGPVTVNGYTQPGASPNSLATGNDAVLLIQLNGAAAGVTTHGLVVRRDSSTIRGLVINRFGGDGILLQRQATGSGVVGNFIGTDPAGTVDRGNGGGVAIRSGDGNTVGGITPAERNLISGNQTEGVFVEGDSADIANGNQVAGNYIGTDRTGTADLGNEGSGVTFASAVRDNGLGGTAAGAGNVVSGNDGDGARVAGGSVDVAAGNHIVGNLIGTDAGGTADLGNEHSGVEIDGASNNSIGGGIASARNVISGNGIEGISIFGSASTGNQVVGNFIGTDVDGTSALGNADDGVAIAFGAGGNTIGGTSGQFRNVISGNGDGFADDGVDIDAGGNLVSANYIGTDENGESAIGNSGAGVRITEGEGSTVGGMTAGEGNVISGNGADGVVLINPAENSAVRRNFIGTAKDGTTALGNGDDGVAIVSSPDNTIGGTAVGAGNRIAHNDGDGVIVFGGDAVGNRILSNSTFSNSDLGIDLASTGVTANDDDDPDSPGSNNRLQNFPVITSATRSQSAGFTTISGRLNSTPSSSFTIQCFVAAPDPSDHGEGRTPLGQTTATTNANGDDNSFTCVTPQQGQVVTATATNTTTGDTSEFSQNVGVTTVP